MRTFCVVCVIGLLMHCAMACSAPQPRIEKAPLVERGEQASTQCTGADWRAARLCDDEACAAAALGATCSECLSELTPDTCNACLGERLCAHSDNMEIAQRVTKPHANALPDVRAHKVGRFPIGGLEGASRRGQELVVVGAGGLLGESRRSSASMPDLEAVVTPFQHSVLTAQDELLWQIPGTLDECLAPTVSPMGRWVATVCGASIRVYALATGFLHHELQLAEAVEPSGHLELSNLSPLYHCFGGDGWLALPTTQGWSRINLDDGGRTTIANAGDSAAMNAFRLDDDDFRVALAWDGSHVAVGSRHGASIEVLTVDGSAASKIDTGAVVNDFAFDGSRSLIVSTTDNFARYDLTGAQVGQAPSTSITEQIAGGRAWWVRTVEQASADVFQPLGRIPTTLTPTPPDTGRTHDPPRGLIALDTVVALDDGSFVGGAPSFGVTYFDAAGRVLTGELGRGEALWLTAIPGSREVVIGHDQGVRAWNIDTFEGRAIDLPAEYAQTPPRFIDGHVIATGGSEQPFTGLERNERLFVTTPGGKQHRLTLDTAIEAFAFAGGLLHVATRTGITTFDVREDEPQPHAAHRFPNALEPVKGETATFSADGKFSLVLKDGEAKLYETGDYTRSIDTFPAASCAFSTQAATVACLSVAKDRSVRLHSYDLVHRTEITSHSADSAVAKALSILRILDVTADGQRIALGRGAQWITIADLAASELLGPRGNRAAFVGDEVASTDGVYLYAADLGALATSRDRLPD